MKNAIQIAFFCMVLIACSNSKREKLPVDSFDFALAEAFEAYSIKFTQSDTVFIRQHGSSRDYMDANSAPQTEINYITFLEKEDRTKLYRLLSTIDFAKYNTEYYEHYGDYKDGFCYAFKVKKDTLNKSFRIHSSHAPVEFDSLATLLITLKSRLHLKKYDKEISCPCQYMVMPPPPPLLPTNHNKQKQVSE